MNAAPPKLLLTILGLTQNVCHLLSLSTNAKHWNRREGKIGNSFNFEWRGNMFWKLHQFHPDADSWHIFGNILDHLLNLSGTSQNLTKVKHQEKIPLFENLESIPKIWWQRFFLHVCDAYAYVIGLYTCHGNYVIFTVYPTLHIYPVYSKPTNVISHHILNKSFLLSLQCIMLAFNQSYLNLMGEIVQYTAIEHADVA